MIAAKRSNAPGKLDKLSDLETYIRILDEDLEKLFLLTQGMVRFGAGTTAKPGENLSGQWRQFTSGSANVEFPVPHTIGAVPVGRIVMWQDKAGSLYQGPTTGTSWTSTNAYFKCDAASVTFLVFLLK